MNLNTKKQRFIPFKAPNTIEEPQMPILKPNLSKNKKNKMTLEPLSLPKKHSMAVFDKPAASPLATELTANWKKVRDLTPVRTPEFVGDKIPGKLKSKFVPAQIPKENVSPNRMVPEIQNELVDITNLPKPKIKKNFVPSLKLLDPTKIKKE